MAEKRIIEQTASTEVYNDDWLVKDSVTQGTTKITPSQLKEYFNDGQATETDLTALSDDISLGADGTVYLSAGDAVRGQIRETNKSIEETTLLEKIKGTFGYYINTSYSPVDIAPISTSSNMSYIIESCTEGDYFTIYGEGGQSGLLWAFIDENNNVLNSSRQNEEVTSLTLIAPKNSNKIIVNYYDGGALYKGALITKEVDSIKELGFYNFNKYEAKAGYGLVNVVEYDSSFIGQDYRNHLRLIQNGYGLFIPCEDVYSIKYPTFVSSSSIGMALIDENNLIIGGYVETSTAGYKEIIIPKEAKTIFISINGATDNNGYNITKNGIISTLPNINKNLGGIYNKSESYGLGEKINADYIYTSDGLVVGTTNINDLHSFNSNGAYSIKIPMQGVKSISYPTFKTSSNGISFFCDSNNIVIWAYSEEEKDTNTNKFVEVPPNAAYFVLTISVGLNAYNWYYAYNLLSIYDQEEETPTDKIITPFENVNTNMCLAGIKTSILDNKLPYHSGYLFHKLQNDDKTLWYGEDFKTIKKIGQVTFSPKLMRFAISPKDGRVIAVQRDTRNGIWIWDGTTETHLNSFNTNPLAWLYNSGVDFIKDGNDEYCIFAEYVGDVVSGRVLNVWRGKYPYTSASNWEIVFTQEQVTNITHFHMIRRDPWTNILYLTAGDYTNECKWWYSTDNGANWTLLVSGNDTGWGNSLCRTINFIFTKDFVYWATDHGEAGTQQHTLNRIARNETTGVLDLSTKEQLAVLPQLYATNSLCYVESPNGLFMYDRIDIGATAAYGKPLTMKFWDFETETLKDIVSLNLINDDWGGSRGKCYINYTNSKQVMPAMGFSIDTPCVFDIICDNPANIGTIAYDIGAKNIKTINY